MMVAIQNPKSSYNPGHLMTLTLCDEQALEENKLSWYQGDLLQYIDACASWSSPPLPSTTPPTVLSLFPGNIIVDQERKQ